MVSLRRRRFILGLDPGKDNPLPLHCENVSSYRKRFRRTKSKSEHDLLSDSGDGIIPADRMSSSRGGGRRLRCGAGAQNRAQGGSGKVAVRFFTQSASHSSGQKEKTQVEPSLPEVYVRTYEKKDEKFVEPPSAVVCDNFTMIMDNLPSQQSGDGAST